MTPFGQKLSIIRGALGIAHGSRAFGGPIQANIDVTARCNIRCIHCYYHSPVVTAPNIPEVRLARMEHRELPDDDWSRDQLRMEASATDLHRVLDSMLKLGTRRFQFSGTGETFTHPEIMEFVTHVKKSKSYCVTNTNGTLLDPPKMNLLVQLGFDELRVSVLAGTSKVYQDTHPSVRADMFERLRDNFLYLSQRKKETNRNKPALSLVMIIMSPTANDLLHFAEFADEMGAQKAIYRILDDVEDPGLRQLELTEEQRVEARAQLIEAAQFLDNRRIKHNIPNVLQVVRRQLDTTKFYRHIPCYYGWLSARVNASGEIRPCCRCYMTMGNAFQQDFAEIWNGEAYRRFRRDALHLPAREAPVKDCDCGSCVHHNANLRVFKALHPLKWQFVRSKLDVLSMPDGED